MKTLWMLIGVLLLAALTPTLTSAQVLKRMADRAKQRVEGNIGNKVDKGIDDVMSGKKKKKKVVDTAGVKKGEQGAETVGGATTVGSESTTGNNEIVGSTTVQTGPSLKSYSKFDFIPGEKIMVVEDFSQDVVGDFPDKWNTNSTGEVVTVDGRDGKFLSITKDGVYMPEFITNLPDNFTLEFDLLCNPEFSYYSSGFVLYFADLKNKKSFADYKEFGPAKRQAMEVWIKPTAAGNSSGEFGYKVWENGGEVMQNNMATAQFHAIKKNAVKVSIWRQKQRVRVYLNEEKVLDLPKAISTEIKYNSLLFMTGSLGQDGDKYLLGNLRLAVGAPDTRHKLLDEGKFVTTGILFDVNSATIRGESYGVLKDIGTVLKENPSVKVKIIGHTDADGDEASNLELSKLRAASVKQALISQFGIDGSRLETDGLGESQPVDSNDSVVGKSNNRRVEFLKQ